MLISQKCQYALRASFELAKQCGRGPVKIAAIAKAQAIPVRFLEVILSQLKQGGFVASRRGSDGGYYLARQPDALTVGAIIRFIEGPIGPIGCVADPHKQKHCPLYGNCAFYPMWDQVRRAIEDVYYNTTLANLVEQDHQRRDTSNESHSTHTV